MSLGNVLNVLVLKKNAAGTSQRVKRTSGAPVFILFLSIARSHMHSFIANTPINPYGGLQKTRTHYVKNVMIGIFDACDHWSEKRMRNVQTHKHEHNCESTTPPPPVPQETNIKYSISLLTTTTHTKSASRTHRHYCYDMR